MSRNRRDFFARAASLGAGLFAGTKARADQHEGHAGQPARTVPVETPDLPKLPYKLVDGVKEFHLAAEVVRREIVPGKVLDVWGYNGTMPGPTIEANQGDRVRFVFENRLPERTSIHWHGLEVPMEMDGVPGLGMDPIPPAGKFTYEFTLTQHGTFFYHAHAPMQEMMGQIGLLVIYPKTPYHPAVDRDFGLILQEWMVLPNNSVPNSMAMDYNWLTLNGKSGPACTPMLVKQGERVRIRMVNLGMDHHPMHLHGNTFYVTGTEGGRVPEACWTPQNTVLVGVAQARDVEFDARYTGDWMLHCHLPHHMMNEMMSAAGPISPLVANDHHLHGSAPDAKQVPGFPQDMWMTMDEQVDKPENHGLRPGWTGAMMGMMTLVRVLKPEMYDRIMELKKTAPKEGSRGPAPMHKHDHK
ncbi:MAG: copper oxidase [Acidobacteria bacterium]|nr:copper oxidase [Acidobacteriota bacterium]MBI3472624.1 copper oxidase [Candidatus Solibacter usitatus]